MESLLFEAQTRTDTNNERTMEWTSSGQLQSKLTLILAMTDFLLEYKLKNNVRYETSIVASSIYSTMKFHFI